MPTQNQLINNCRKKHTSKIVRDVLYGKPQIEAVILEIIIKHPRKPNSACRKFARVMLKNGSIILARIRGIGHNLQPHDKVLVAGGGARDIPGTGSKYDVVGGARDHVGSSDRKKGRSKIGTKRKNTK